MAFDANQLFYDGVTLTTATNSTVVTVSKTPANGIGIELACTATTSSTGTLDVVVKAGNTTTVASMSTIATFAQITSAGGVRYLVVQTNKSHLALVPTTGGTSPGFVVKAGIVSGPSMSDGKVS